MMKIFIDSSALFAWGDRSSKDGEKIASLILERQTPLITTNLIFAETLSLVTKRVNKHKGIELGEKILSSKALQLIYLDEKLQKDAWQLYKKYKDKDFDFIDATSFVFCQKHSIKEVLTFDHHFKQMGYEVHPK